MMTCSTKNKISLLTNLIKTFHSFLGYKMHSRESQSIARILTCTFKPIFKARILTNYNAFSDHQISLFNFHIQKFQSFLSFLCVHGNINIIKIRVLAYTDFIDFNSISHLILIRGEITKHFMIFFFNQSNLVLCLS